MKREVTILGLSYSSSQLGSYVCVLSELNGHRKLPIIVKPQDAQVIALSVENVKSPRPMTHDILKESLESFQIDCQEVTIYEVMEGVFYARILLHNGVDDTIVEVTASDAIAISKTFDCPLYVTEKVLNLTGIEMDELGNLQPDNVEEKVEKVISKEDLGRMMDDAIAVEDYELAAKLRDKISERGDEVDESNFSVSKCDICGNTFTGESHLVHDENYNEIEGLIMCNECFKDGLGEM